MGVGNGLTKGLGTGTFPLSRDVRILDAIH
jgi:hypothetical protein